MDTQLIITLSLIHLVALISPGPDFAIIIRLATLESRRVAIAAALGIATAIALHTLLSLTGVSIAIHNSPQLYAIVQLIGASYLGWMGLGAIRSALTRKKEYTPQDASNLTTQAASQAPLNWYQGLRIGLFTNLLNPKALVFFITLFSALITPTVTLGTKVAAGIMLFSLSFIWFALVSILLSTPQIQQRFKHLSKFIDGLTGALFLVVAFAILYQLATG